MKKYLPLLILPVLLASVWLFRTEAGPDTLPETTAATTAAATVPPETTRETEAPDIYAFTEEEEKLLLRLGMAERGDTGCTECVALVMRTVLNRVEGEKFADTIREVIYTEGQFTPVEDGSFWSAQPNAVCREALDMIRKGWDESQGALYYEWCQGESWHSRNLHLLTQHCDMRLYD